MGVRASGPTVSRGEAGGDLIGDVSGGPVPGIFGRYRRPVNAALAVGSEEAVGGARRLGRGRDPSVGPSRDANLVAARGARVLPGPWDRRHAVLRRGEERTSERFAAKDAVRVDAETFT